MSRRWGLLVLVFFGILISYVDRGNLSIAAVAMMRDFKIAPESMGVLLSAFFWTYALFQMPAGLLVDKFGIRLVYAGAFFLWSIASAGVALSRGPHDVVALRMLLGLAESIGPLASLACIRQNFKASEQGLPVAIYVGGQTIGPACGALLGATLLGRYGWRTLFAATGLGALLWIPFWAYFAPRGRAQSKEASTPFEWPWQLVFSAVPFWAMSACVFLLSYYWYFVLTWMPSYLTMARRLLHSWYGANFVRATLYDGRRECVGGCACGQIDHQRRPRVCSAPRLPRCRVTWSQRHIAAECNAWTRSGPCDSGDFHLLLWCGKFELLGYRSVQFALTTGGTRHRISEYSVAAGRSGCAALDRVELRAAEGFSSGHPDRWSLPNGGCWSFTIGGPEEARSAEGNVSRRRLFDAPQP